MIKGYDACVEASVRRVFPDSRVTTVHLSRARALGLAHPASRVEKLPLSLPEPLSLGAHPSLTRTRISSTPTTRTLPAPYTQNREAPQPYGSLVSYWAPPYDALSATTAKSPSASHVPAAVSMPLPASARWRAQYEACPSHTWLR